MNCGLSAVVSVAQGGEGMKRFLVAGSLALLLAAAFAKELRNEKTAH